MIIFNKITKTEAYVELTTENGEKHIIPTSDVIFVNDESGFVSIKNTGSRKTIGLISEEDYDGGDEPIPYDKKYLTIEALEDGDLTFTKSNNTLYYSLDKTTWNPITSADTISFHAGDKIMLKGTNMTVTSGAGIGTIKFSGNHNVYGNILTLISGDEFPQQFVYSTYQFRNLFNGDTKLISAENLILLATTLASNCYNQMFRGCTSLTTTPALPVTTLVRDCYHGMFQNCTSLVTAPELPATTLVDNCYMNMFNGCTNLTIAPELPATTLADSCYRFMFYNCRSLNHIKAMFTTTPSDAYTNNWVFNVASSGTFVKNSAATWNVSGYNGIPNGWTVETASE